MLDFLNDYLTILFYLIPFLTPFVTFLISLVLFVREMNRKKRQDVRFASQKLTLYIVLLIASGIMIAVMVGFVMILASAVAYM